MRDSFDLLKHELLDEKTIHSLVEKCQKTGDISAQNQIILAHQRLIFFEVKKYMNMTPVLSIEDLISEGTLGIIKAIKNYDLSLPNKAKFSTYAASWIFQIVMKKICENFGMLRLPYSVFLKIGRYNKALRKLSKIYPEVSVDMISKEIDETREVVQILRSVNQTVGSTDASVNGNNGSSLGEFISEGLYGEISSPEDISLQKLQTEKIKILLGCLTSREREIIELRFGFYDNNKKTLEFIGNKFNITRERIRQIEKIALKKLKKALKNDFKTSFFNDTSKSYQQFPG